MQYLTAKVVCVSIHAPHEGERPYILPRCRHIRQFQSTLPTRGSDYSKIKDGKSSKLVSIHAPHEGERRCTISRRRLTRLFQSTLPTRGSDFYGKPFVLLPWVSIHAPHEGERPLEIYSHLSAQKGFNPRSPRGGATRFCHYREVSYGVSIHAPHEGERRVCAMCRLLRRSFNPRSPRGGATHTVLLSCSLYLVSIHAPHEGERHAVTYTPQTLTVVSIHAPHEGERLGGRWCTA